MIVRLPFLMIAVRLQEGKGEEKGEGDALWWGGMSL